MIKLKELLKEELLTEATRWNVGIEDPTGKVTAVYGHWDGYLGGVGSTLKKHYKNPAKVKELIKLGSNGISTLDKDIKGGKDHSFDSPQKGQTVFYGRDRGEKTLATDKYKDRDAYARGFDQQYAYLFRLKDKKWYVYDRHGNKNWELL